MVCYWLRKDVAYARQHKAVSPLCCKYHAPKLNRIIILTPNEGLSKQHLQELFLSDMQAKLFSKNSDGLFQGKTIDIIDVNKLAEKMVTRRLQWIVSRVTILYSLTRDTRALAVKCGKDSAINSPSRASL